MQDRDASYLIFSKSNIDFPRFHRPVSLLALWRLLLKDKEEVEGICYYL